MASKSSKTNTLSDLKKSGNFHRVMTLHYDCGVETVRQFIEHKLVSSGISLKDHLTSCKMKLLDLFQKQVINKDQWKILLSKDPKLSAMDVTLLTLLLIHTFTSLSAVEQKKIRELRTKRNSMAHIVKGELDDNVPFNEASRLIIDIAKGISKEFHEHIKDCISELEKRELVLCRSNLELVQNNNEELVVKLVENSCSENVDSTAWIRFGLTKWVKQLSRRLELSEFLKKLKDKGVLTYTEKRRIEETYNNEEQAHMLVLHMVHESAERLFQFCICLRDCSPELADLIENNNTDGKNTDDALHDIEMARIKTLLEDVIRADRTQSVACDEVHIYVEDKLGWTIDYSGIEHCVMETFNIPKLEKDASRFEGVSWKAREKDLMVSASVSDEAEITTDLPCEKFATYLSQELEEIRTGLGEKIQTAVLSESISSKIFVKMTAAELKETFSEYLGDIKYGVGITKVMSEVQSKFKLPRNQLSADSDVILRPFDSTTGNTAYTNGHVRPSTGNLLVPAHEFVTFPGNKLDIPYLVKEVVKFTAACLNGRKNGTIHFGIRASANGTGTIIGIDKDGHVDTERINFQIVKGIEQCFVQSHVQIAQRCVRPIQEIKLDNQSLVLEVDVIPFSGHVGEEMFEICYPPKGKQRQLFFVYDLSPHCEISVIVPSKVDIVKKAYETTIQQRRNLEVKYANTEDKNVNLGKQLIKLLTCGNDYVTDEFSPIICSGNISGSNNESQIRAQLNIDAAYTSSMTVFDFDSSVSLRHKIEKDKKSFYVKMVEDFGKRQKENESQSTERAWVYCNGNEELCLDSMDREQWFINRLENVKNAFDRCRDHIPETRALVVFLVFEKTTDRDPMLEIARHCMLFTFRDECVIIAEDEEIVRDWKKEIGHANVDRCFHAGSDYEHSFQNKSRCCL